MQKVLIIQTAFLGDVILATPVAETLKANFPNLEIHFLVKAGNEGLIAQLSSLQKVWVFHKKEGKLREMKRLIRAFRKEKYDLVINLHRFGSSGILTALSGGKQKIGFKKNPFSFAYTEKIAHELKPGVHEVDRNLSTLKSLPIREWVRQPKVEPSAEQFAKVQALKTDDYYCIAPASVWFTKQLPQEKWVELIRILRKNGKVYVLGGPADQSLCETIIRESGEECTNLAGQLSLLESAALMKNAKRNYVNDSGPLHFASAMNAPTTAFFCSTTPDFGFGPLSDDAQLVEISAKELACKPCGLHGHRACPEGHFKCGNVPLEKVIQ